MYLTKMFTTTRRSSDLVVVNILVAVRVSIAVVAAIKLEYSKDLNDAPVAISYLVGCGGSSRAEADVQ